MRLKPKAGSWIAVVDAQPRDYQAEVAELQAASSPAAAGKPRTTSVKFYTDARSALRHLKRRPPELCIINMQLPDMPGLDLYHMLIDRWPGIPIYLVGDQYDPEDEIRARCSGATLYFCKPLESGWLAAATQLVA